MKIEVQEKYLKTGNCEMDLSLFQAVVMIRLASSSPQEANAMAGLSWKWLEWSGEVQLWCSIFELGNGWRWCYSRVTGTWMAYVWCLEAFGSKRPKNARVKWKFEVLGWNMQQWWFLMQFWVLEVLRACVFACYVAIDFSFCMECAWMISFQNARVEMKMVSFLLKTVKFGQFCAARCLGVF